MYKIIGADGNEYGPITAEQVRQWIAEGRLNAVSKIQPDGFADWKELRELSEFATQLPGSSPPSPPPISLGANPPPFTSPAASTNALAGWSLGTGIASLSCCCVLLFAPVSIVLGAVAISQLNQNPQQSGRAMAISGIVLGCIGLLMGVVFWLVLMPILLDPNQMQKLGR